MDSDFDDKDVETTAAMLTTIPMTNLVLVYPRDLERKGI